MSVQICSVVLASLLLACGAHATDQSTAPATLPLQAYGPLALPFDQTHGLSLVLETDLGVIAPDLQKIPRDDPALLGAGNLVDAERLVKQVGWGDAAPYLYSAVIDALGRLYNSLSIDLMRLSDGTALLQRGPLRAGILHIRVFGNRQLYQAAAQGTSHSGQDGYWNPRTNEVGIFIDVAILDLARRLEDPGQTEGRIANIETLRAFIYQRLLYKVGHELFHAIQANQSNDAYLFPLVSEATAMMAQDNLLTRENMITLIRGMQTMGQMGQDEKNAAACDADGIRAFNIYRLRRLIRAYEVISRDPAFSVTSLLAMDDNSFGTDSGAEMLDRYAVSYAFLDVLLSLDRTGVRSYETVMSELTSAGSIARSRSDAEALDKIFRERLTRLAQQLWLNPKAEEQFTKATQRVTACQQAWNLANAFGSAAEAFAYKPQSPTGPLYAGDIFYQLRQPLLALDFYLMAREASSRPGADDYVSRIQSRVADASELIGDVDGAIAAYSSIISKAPENPALLQTWVRAALKLEYYNHLQQRGILIRGKHVEQLNLLLNGFGEALLTDPRYAAAVAANDLATFQAVVQEKALATRAVLMRDASQALP
jgi:tetratricopeptide (TPR) repeat protein